MDRYINPLMPVMFSLTSSGNYSGVRDFWKREADAEIREYLFRQHQQEAMNLIQINGEAVTTLPVIDQSSGTIHFAIQGVDPVNKIEVDMRKKDSSKTPRVQEVEMYQPGAVDTTQVKVEDLKPPTTGDTKTVVTYYDDDDILAGALLGTGASDGFTVQEDPFVPNDQDGFLLVDELADQVDEVMAVYFKGFNQRFNRIEDGLRILAKAIGQRVTESVPVEDWNDAQTVMSSQAEIIQQIFTLLDPGVKAKVIATLAQRPTWKALDAAQGRIAQRASERNLEGVLGHGDDEQS